MDKTAIGFQVSSMPCLIVLLMEDNLAEGMKFVEFVEDLPDNSVKRKKKHFILMAQNVDYSLLQNRTGNVDVHIISQDGQGVCFVSVVYLYYLLSKVFLYR